MTLDGISFGVGATLTICCALSFGLQIIGLGAWSSQENMFALTFVQISTVAVVSWIGAIPGGIGTPVSVNGWLGILATGAFATAFALVLQTWAQSLISPTKAGIIYTLEPAFAALFAFLGGEHVGPSTLEGGSLVVLAMVMVELRPNMRDDDADLERRAARRARTR
jgi:drug/metabolite transporter (DMT)-like permease